MKIVSVVAAILAGMCELWPSRALNCRFDLVPESAVAA